MTAIDLTNLEDMSFRMITNIGGPVTDQTSAEIGHILLDFLVKNGKAGHEKAYIIPMPNHLIVLTTKKNPAIVTPLPRPVGLPRP